MRFTRHFKLAVPAVVILACLLVAGCGGSDDEGDDAAATGGGDEPIFIGIAAAKTGFLGAFEGEYVQAFQLRIKEINEEGGILGRQVRTEWIDTKTDRAASANASRELLDKGADVLLVTSDFDYGGPGAIEANRDGVVAISLGAGAPQFADATTIGPFAFSFGSGGEEGGALGAEFMFERDAKNAYLLTDESVQVMKTAAQFFKARFEELGGTIVGEDNFIGGDNVDVRTQVTRLRGFVDQIDFIFIPSYHPPGSTVMRAIRDAGIDTPIVSTTTSLYGPAMTDVTGPISDYIGNAYGCVLDCSGDDSPEAEEFMEKFEAEYGNPPETAANPIQTYDLGSFLKAAIEQAKTTEGEALQEALETLPPQDLIIGETRMSPTCHRPIRRPFTLFEYQDGKATFLERRAPEKVPPLDPSITCAGQ